MASEKPSSIRARHLGTPNLVYEVDATPYPPTAIAVRTMNFGQHWRTPNVDIHQYRVELPRSLLAEVLDTELADIVDDSRRFPPTPDEDFESALASASWPTPQAVSTDFMLENLALAYFALDRLGHWFGDGLPEGRPGVILNTVESTGLAVDRCWVAGTCAFAANLRAYQDL